MYIYLCRYGVEKMELVNEKMFISLTYSPKNATLKKKLGKFPVDYWRTNGESKEDLALYEEALKKFTRREEKADDKEEEQARASPAKRIKRELPPPPHRQPQTEVEFVSLLDEDDDFTNAQPFFENC